MLASSRLISRNVLTLVIAFDTIYPTVIACHNRRIHVGATSEGDL